MKIKNGISPAILVAATSMLQQYIPDLTPTNLVAALKAFETADETAKRMTRQSVEKPYTCNEVCELLGVTCNQCWLEWLKMDADGADCSDECKD